MSLIRKFNEETLIRFIQSRPEYPWDWKVLSHHPNLNLRTLEFFHEKPWDWEMVSGNDAFEWKWVLALPDKSWPWSRFYIHHKFSWKWVDDFPNKQWNWRMLSHSVDSPLRVSKYRDKPWDWLMLTLNDDIPLEFMMAHPDFPWVTGELFFSKIYNTTIDYLRMHQHAYTRIDWIDHTKHTDWYYIRMNLDLPWDLQSIDWKYGDLTLRDIDFLVANQADLDIEKISAVADYNSVIKRIPEINWDFKGLSRNPTFSQKDMKSTGEYDLNRIHLVPEPEKLYAAQTIQRYWKRAITDPNRKMCRDSLMKWFELEKSTQDSTHRHFAQ